MSNTPKLYIPPNKKLLQEEIIDKLPQGEEEKTGYDQFSQKVLITHKFADAYGWDHDQIWKKLPYPDMKEHLKLFEMLENDDNAFTGRVEAAIFKCMKRLYGKKKDK